MKKENDPHVILAGPAHEIKEESKMPTDQEFKSNGNTDLQVQESTMPLHTVSLSNISDLDNAEVAPVDLMSDYWTPVVIGESKRVLFDKIDITPVLSADGSGEIIELECAFFFIKDGDSAKRIRNGSKKLVGSLQIANVRQGMALEITYLGKKKNHNGPFSSDTWSVKPLVINKK